MKTNKRGISLIVLVITIIIMIILAGAIILTLSSNGIIGKANDATKTTDLANAKQVVSLAKGEWDLVGKVEGYDTLKEYAEAKLEETGFSVGKEKAGSYHVSTKGELYRYPVIPEGFVVSNISSEQTIEEGLVIYEIPEAERNSVNWTAMDGYGSESYIDVQEKYNQFVWVPVPEINDFILRDGYYDGKLEKYVSGNLVKEPYNSNEVAEYNTMKSSVEKYGGFYIARYEAGTTEQRTNTGVGTSFKADGITPDVLVKRNIKVYNYVGWGSGNTNISGDITNEQEKDCGIGAVALARSLYPETLNKGVVSTLIYGVQWDATMNFMKDVENPNVPGKPYIQNSTGMGRPGSVGNTGLKDEYSVKNIYDMAGNVTEWCMEYRSDMRSLRGGTYDNVNTNRSASSRDHNVITYCRVFYGFRIALYIK